MSVNSPPVDICAVLFDLDGTLIDSAPDLALAGNALRHARKLPPLDLDIYRPHAGSGARGVLHVALGVTPEQADYAALREEFLEAYDRHLLRQTLSFDGVPQLLAGLSSRGARWGIVTNKASRFTLPTMGAFSMFQDACTVICGDTTPHTKPHPAPIFAALQAAHLDPRQTIYVGDDARDIQAGRAAGLRTVAAAYGYLGPDTDPRDWGADAVIHSPLELLKWLDKD
ncbi:HAD-IA family hydrolase [Ottowia sp. GY511]|uniref:HAD family hydrolase n=1 Tax=Ottowia flava TaxID=2675430 RepID=A0ABW4KWU8_9BURK|nr:HAD-IA family hydrolase [Ottowia sp. GY511]TXK26249.1 HAD-IA family hydrolase [Ottowia sp. GY511]